jgi:hypothetical protein
MPNEGLEQQPNCHWNDECRTRNIESRRRFPEVFPSALDILYSIFYGSLFGHLDFDHLILFRISSRGPAGFGFLQRDSSKSCLSGLDQSLAI